MDKNILYCYIRVSSEEQKLKDYSPKRQKELGIKKAKELGIPYEIMEEEAASASRDDFSNRPVFAKLMQLVKDGIAKYLYVFDVTRLSRNDETKSIIDSVFIKKKVVLYTNSKFYDFAQAEDNLVFKILNAVENFESVLRKSRFQLGYVSANKAGRFLKGIPPFAYKKDNKGVLIIDKAEKNIYLKMVDMYLDQGLGTNKIAKWLNDNKIPTKTSKVLVNGYTLSAGVHNRKKEKIVLKNTNWNPGTVNSILKNEIYTGKRKFKTGTDTWEYVDVESIIDMETFEKIQLKRTENAITKKKVDKYFYLLKGLLICGKCGSAMHGRIKPNRGESTYRCNSKRTEYDSCKSQGVNIEKLNNLILFAYMDTLQFQASVMKGIESKKNNPDQLLNIIEEKTRLVKKEQLEINKIEKRIQDILTSLSESVSSNSLAKAIKTLTNNKKEFENKVSLLQAEIKAIKDRLSSRNKSNKKNDLFKDSFLSVTNYIKNKECPIEDRKQIRQFLQTAFHSITVLWVPEEKAHEVTVKFLTSDFGIYNVPPATYKLGVSGQIHGLEKNIGYNIFKSL